MEVRGERTWSLVECQGLPYARSFSQGLLFARLGLVSLLTEQRRFHEKVGGASGRRLRLSAAGAVKPVRETAEAGAAATAQRPSGRQGMQEAIAVWERLPCRDQRPSGRRGSSQFSDPTVGARKTAAMGIEILLNVQK